MKRVFYALLLLIIGGGFGYIGYEKLNVVSLSSYYDNSIPDTDKFSEISLDCLAEPAIDELKSVDELEKNGAFDRAYLNCRSELQLAMRSDFEALEENAIRAVFSAIVAAQFAEYGNSSAVSWKKIKDSKYLNCGNTILLAGHLYGKDETSLRSIGFDGGAIGNHAQLYYKGKSELLLDPTTGLVAKVGFDDLLRGKPVPRHNILMFAVKAKTIDSFRNKVFSAVVGGKYRPSDFMYMHESIDEHLKKGSSDNYFTPGGIYIRNILKKS